MCERIILVYPPKIEGTAGSSGDISLSLLYLAGAVRDICNDINIFDFNAPLGKGKTSEDLLNLIREKKDVNTIIGFNCLFSALFPGLRKIAKEIKKEFPETKIVAGGMHPTLFAKDIINNCEEIDAVVVGEGDVSFPELVKYFYGGGT